jgi:hypothetical protein
LAAEARLKVGKDALREIGELNDLFAPGVSRQGALIAVGDRRGHAAHRTLNHANAALTRSFAVGRVRGHWVTRQLRRTWAFTRILSPGGSNGPAVTRLLIRPEAPPPLVDLIVDPPVSTTPLHEQMSTTMKDEK